MPSDACWRVAHSSFLNTIALIRRHRYKYSCSRYALSLLTLKFSRIRTGYRNCDFDLMVSGTNSCVPSFFGIQGVELFQGSRVFKFLLRVLFPFPCFTFCCSPAESQRHEVTDRATRGSLIRPPSPIISLTRVLFFKNTTKKSHLPERDTDALHAFTSLLILLSLCMINPFH